MTFPGRQSARDPHDKTGCGRKPGQGADRPANVRVSRDPVSRVRMHSCQGPLLQWQEGRPRRLDAQGSEFVFSRLDLSLFLADLAEHRLIGGSPGGHLETKRAIKSRLADMGQQLPFCPPPRPRPALCAAGSRGRRLGGCGSPPGRGHHLGCCSLDLILSLAGHVQTEGSCVLPSPRQMAGHHCGDTI